MAPASALATLLLAALVRTVDGAPSEAPAREEMPGGLHVTNARLESRLLEGRLGDAVKALGRGPAWIAYPVDASGEGVRCCFESTLGELRTGGCCRLEGRTDRACAASAAEVALETTAQTTSRVFILLRVEDGRVGRVGSYSPRCRLDAGGTRVLALTGVPVAQSLALLDELSAPAPAEGRPAPDRRPRDLAGEALAAIAAHADPAADPLLERRAGAGGPLELREQAAFWLGEARGVRGHEALKRLAHDPDPKFREHLAFAFSICSAPEAVQSLIELARNDRDRKVRGQALFWLAQKAGERAAQAITDAIRHDPETEVKKKAVFALSEMKGGVPLLIQVARENRNPAVREQAYFWLGQSEDPKALAFLAEVLSR
jgi:hypothetical protein